MVPEYDESNPFVRLADSWYGLPDNTRGEDPNVFFGGIGGWRPEFGSRFDPTKEIGYFRFNTGNRTRDAIFSIAANELGADNFVRAVNKLDEGNYWGAAGETLLTAASIGTIGASALSKIVSGSRIGAALPGAISRTAQLPRRSAFVVGPGGAGTTAVGRTAKRGLPERAGYVVRDLRRQGLGRAPIPDSARFARLRRAGRGFGRFGLLGLAGLTAYEAFRGTPAPTAEEARAGISQGTFDTKEDIEVVPGTVEEAATQARVDTAAINRQYNNILNELKSSYQLSETEEERERLRFMLADIEAQRDAGLQAISEGYAETVSQIQEQAVLSGERTAERSQRYGQELEASADRAAQRMLFQQAQQQEDFRGLGSESDQPVNEWVGLMSAMAPAQQLYTQRMGDISREGMEWLASTVGAQGQAQGAELQRLAAATRSGAIARYQKEVSDRINRERELQRAAILDTMTRQASALQSAEQFNVSAAGTNADDEAAFIESMVTGPNVTPSDVQQAFYARNRGQLTPAQVAYIERLGQMRTVPQP